MEFQEKVIKSIFFKKGDSKPKGKKKPEQNIHLVEEKELVETLFNCGLAKYEEASNIAPILMPILLEKLQQLRESIERDLAQQKGVINANFLKYRSVRTIVRTPESMAMLVARIQKEKVKTNEPWRDVNFGPCESDPTGEYSLYYYDKVLPKNWPALDTLQWVPVSSGNLMKQQNYSTHTKRSHLVNLMEILDVFNIRSPTKIHTPFTLLEGILNIIIDSEPPFLCNFFVAEQAPRYVLVDQYLPFIEGTLFGCQGRYAFVEKAYAKLRYCYKGILGIGVQQLLL